MVHHSPAPPNPSSPQLLNCACVLTVTMGKKKRKKSVSQVFFAESRTPHPSRATPFSLHYLLFHNFCHIFAIHPNPPLMGLLINSWSCHDCVHRADVFSNVSACVPQYVCSSNVDQWSKKKHVNLDWLSDFELLSQWVIRLFSFSLEICSQLPIVWCLWFLYFPQNDEYHQFLNWNMCVLKQLH